MPVDRNNLAAQSNVFRDMFEIGEEGSAEVSVSESKELLELFLPYCGREKQTRLNLEQPLAWQLIKSFDKYDVSAFPNTDIAFRD